MAIRRPAAPSQARRQTSSLKQHPMVRALGGRAVVGGRISTDVAMMDRIAAGLPVAALDALVKRYGLRREDVARVIGLPARTLARRQSIGRLNSKESDRLARIARVLVHAEDVLAGPENAGDWLQQTNRALAGNIPLDSLASDIGTVQVNDILHRIEYGMVS